MPMKSTKGLAALLDAEHRLPRNSHQNMAVNSKHKKIHARVSSDRRELVIWLPAAPCHRLAFKAGARVCLGPAARLYTVSSYRFRYLYIYIRYFGVAVAQLARRSNQDYLYTVRVRRPVPHQFRPAGVTEALPTETDLFSTVMHPPCTPLHHLPRPVCAGSKTSFLRRLDLLNTPVRYHPP